MVHTPEVGYLQWRCRLHHSGGFAWLMMAPDAWDVDHVEKVLSLRFLRRVLSVAKDLAYDPLKDLQQSGVLCRGHLRQVIFHPSLQRVSRTVAVPWLISSVIKLRIVLGLSRR